MSKLSRSLPVNLYHNYRKIPFSLEDACTSCSPRFDTNSVMCTNPRYPLIYAIYSLAETNGSILSDIIDNASAVCSQFSVDTYRSTVTSGLKNGIFASIVPSQIDYIYGTNGPTRYILGPEMDRYSSNASYVKFLLGLVGGYNSPSFVKWFSSSNTPCIYN